MLRGLAGSKLGVWLAHGEGRFELPEAIENYNVVAKYSYMEYPGNPNGSDYSIAALASKDGRHLAIMPHLERSLFPWNWPHYPESKLKHEISPWVDAFSQAFSWVQQ